MTDLTHIGHILSTQRQKMSIDKNISYRSHVYYCVSNHKALTANNR